MVTKVFGIIGDPIDQVRSPTIFNKLFQERGVDAVMVPMHVRPSFFTQLLEGLLHIENVCGLIITIPHKTIAASFLTSGYRSSRASIAGAVNALRRCREGWEGDLFDGEGFAKGMEAAGFAITGKNCAVVGCGGAGSAIALALLDRKIVQLSLWDTEKSKCEVLAARLQALYNAKIIVRAPLKSDDIVVNATPLGMLPTDSLPFNVDDLRSDVVVADVIMRLPRTKLIIRAAELGLKTHEGRHMLDHQVDAIWDYFRLPHT